METGPPVKKKRGQRQRLQSDPAVTPPVVESKLATFLLQQFAWGFMTPQLIQQISSLAIQDVNNAKSVQGRLKSLAEIAHIGGSRKLENNMHRDLSKFLQDTMIPKGLTVPMPFKGMPLQDQDITLPHEVFASLFHDYQESWQSTMVPKPELLEQFWESQSDHPAMENHPMKSKADYKSKCLPIGLHGDEVPITGKGKVWSKSMLTFQWLSLLGAGWGPTRMIWIWGGFDKLLDTSDSGSLSVLFRVLSWSLHWLQEGRWPTHNWKGEAYSSETEEGEKGGTLLANGYCGVVWSLMGDLDYFAKSLELPRSTSHNPCCLCRCTLNGEASWKCFSPEANWLSLQWTPADWKLWPDRSKVELFSIPGLTAANVALDYMRNKYLGTDLRQFGSVFYVLVFMVLPNNPQENLLVRWGFIKNITQNIIPTTGMGVSPN